MKLNKNYVSNCMAMLENDRKLHLASISLYSGNGHNIILIVSQPLSEAITKSLRVIRPEIGLCLN